MLILSALARATSPVQITNDLASAQSELADDASLWAEVAGRITFPAARQGDTVVAMTSSPLGRCPRQPPAHAPQNPGPGAAVESIPVSLDGDSGLFATGFELTPRRDQVDGQTTRVCDFLLRGGALQAGASGRLSVALAASSEPGNGGSSDTLVGGLEFALLVLGIGLITVVFIRKRRKQRPPSESTPPPPWDDATPPPGSDGGGNHGRGDNARREENEGKDAPTGERERWHSPPSGADDPSPYDTLGVNPDATQEDLRVAYRELTMRLHPDRNPGFVSEATDRIRAINAAYELLSDPDRRATYDQRSSGRPPAGQPDKA